MLAQTHSLLKLFGVVSCALHSAHDNCAILIVLIGMRVHPVVPFLVCGDVESYDSDTTYPLHSGVLRWCLFWAIDLSIGHSFHTRVRSFTCIGVTCVCKQKGPNDGRAGNSLAPVQPPISPPYELAVHLKRADRLAKSDPIASETSASDECVSSKPQNENSISSVK